MTTNDVTYIRPPNIVIPPRYSLWDLQNGLRYADMQRTLQTYGNAHSQLLPHQKILVNNDGGMRRLKPDGTVGGGCYYNRQRGIKNAVAIYPEIDCKLNVILKPFAGIACCPPVKVNINPKTPCCEKEITDGGAIRTYRPRHRFVPSHHA